MSLMGLVVRILTDYDDLNLVQWKQIQSGKGIAWRWVYCLVGAGDGEMFFPYNTSSIIIMLKMTSNKNETKWDKEYFSMQLDLYKSKQNEKDSVALLTVPIPQIWPRRQSRVRQNDA